MTTGLEERLTRDLARLAGRIDPVAPAPLELVERRALAVGPPSPDRPRRGVVLAAATGAVAALVGSAVVLGVPRSPTPAPVTASEGATVSGIPSASPSPAPFVLSSGGAVLTPALTPMAAERPMSSPRWSDDGRWIAVQTEPAGDIHVVAADASSDRVVWRGDINAYAWSTAGPPLLAVLPRRGGLAVVEPGGRVRWVLARGVPVISVAWRGADLSWALGSPRGRIGLLTADGVRHTITGAPAADLLFAHWVGTDHLLAWLGGPGRDETGGLDLADLRVEGDRVTAAPVLTTSLVAPAWVVPGPAGTAAADSVLVVGGGGAIPWRDKSVVRCGLADDACAPLLAADPSVVTLDPAWSPDADSVAFVEAAAWQPGEPGNVDDWFPTRRLWVVGADGTGARPVAGAGPGATAPSWSPAGSWLRYNTGDAVVAVPAAGGDAVTLAGGLSGGGAGAGPDGYGKGPWTALVAWSPTAA